MGISWPFRAANSVVRRSKAQRIQCDDALATRVLQHSQKRIRKIDKNSRAFEVYG